MTSFNRIELKLENSKGKTMLVVLTTLESSTKFFSWAKQFHSPTKDKQAATDELFQALVNNSKAWNAHNN